MERAADTPSKGESIGDSQIAGISNDLGVFDNIVVKNPAGKGFTQKEKTGFGLGLSVDAPTTSFIKNFMRTHAAAEDKFIKDPETGEERERFSNTDDMQLPSWKEVNRAVGNFVRQRANNNLSSMGLGRVAQNPISRYDGMDTSKIGVILDKKFGKGKIKFRQF